MLQPKRTKFRKAHKGRIHGFAKGGTDLNFGSFGLNDEIISPGFILLASASKLFVLPTLYKSPFFIK